MPRSMRRGQTVNMINVTEHKRLIDWTLQRYGLAHAARGTISYQDLLQEGYLGLLRASSDWNSELGAWSTYASWWVRSFVGRFLRERWRTVRVPCYLQDRRRKAGERVHPFVKSLDAPLNHDDDGVTLGDLLRSNAPSPEDEVADLERKAELSALMARARLTPRQLRIIDLRCRDVTLEEIGTALGVGRERVRQLEAEALCKIRLAAGVPADAPRASLDSRRKPRSAPAYAQP